MRYSASALLMLAFLFFATDSSAIEQKTELSKTDYPSVYEIVHHCKEQITGGVSESFFDLYKKPEGYFFVIRPVADPDNLVKEIKVWDAKTSEYLDFNIDDITSETIKYDQFPSIYNRADYFDFHLYYGYGDWTVDVIEALENIKNPTLWQLEQLARAYDHQSMDYIRPLIWGNASTIGQKYLKKTGYEHISKERLNGFMKCADKSLKYYDRIIAKKKDYQTFKIGDVQLKRANNCVHYYNTLLSVKEEKLAQKYLKRAKYPEGYIALAEQYIENCNHNGVLFTNGDTDTFPLWYVQAKNKYRTDVTVINLSLLQTFWYMQMQRERTDLVFKTDYKTFEEDDNYLIVFDVVNSVKSMSVQNLIDEINQLDTIDYEHPGIQKMDKLLIDISGTSVQFELKYHYMYLVDLVVLDILENNPQRTFYFTSPFSIINSYEFNSTLANRGLVYELTHDPQMKFSDQATMELFEEEAKNMTNRTYADWRFYSNYLIQLSSYITSVKQNDTESFEAIKQKLNTILPDEVIFSNSDIINLYGIKIGLLNENSESEISAAVKKLRAVVTSNLKNREFTNRTLQDDQGYISSVSYLYSSLNTIAPNNEELNEAIRELLQFIGKIESKKEIVDSHPSLPKLEYSTKTLEELLEQ